MSEFYDLNEVPPKVSVKVDSLTSLTFNAQGEQVAPNITTSYDAILETTYKDDATVYEGINNDSDRCAKLYNYAD